MFNTAQYSVSGTAVELSAGFDSDQEYEIRVSHDSGVQVYIGSDNTVSSSTGYPLPFAADETVLRLQSEQVWAVVTSGAPGVVKVLAYSV